MRDRPLDIPFLSAPPSYQEFLTSYLLSNKPVLIAGLTSTWPASARWVTTRKSSECTETVIEPNWGFLEKEYGDIEVVVADCEKRDFSDQERSERKLRDVLRIWRSCRDDRPKDGEGGQMLYVKDWHLAKASVEAFYETPEIFRDDWMNDYYLSHTDDDFRFVYMGSPGTFTPLHCDVYGSYSWSSNICGTKIWRLFPPDQSKWLRRDPDSRTSGMIWDVREVDEKVFKDFGKTEPLTVVQRPGETIFVPSGYHHQVENVDFCISINHNWSNSCNLIRMYHAMKDEVKDVELALSDVKDLLQQAKPDEWEKEWYEIVQDIVRKDAGWDWATFWSMLSHVAESRTGKQPPSGSEWDTAPSHLRPPEELEDSMIRTCLEDFETEHENGFGGSAESSVCSLRNRFKAMTVIV